MNKSICSPNFVACKRSRDKQCKCMGGGKLARNEALQPKTEILAQRIRGETGNMTVLSIGFMVVILLLLAATTAITGVYLQRNALQRLADGTALAAAHSQYEPSYYSAPGNTPKEKLQPLAQAQAVAFLRTAVSQETRVEQVKLEQVQVLPTGVIGIKLSAEIHPPLVDWVMHGTGTTWRISVHSYSQRT